MALAKRKTVGGMPCYGTNHNFFLPKYRFALQVARRGRPQRLDNEDFSVLGRKRKKEKEKGTNRYAVPKGLPFTPVNINRYIALPFFLTPRVHYTSGHSGTLSRHACHPPRLSIALSVRRCVLASLAVIAANPLMHMRASTIGILKLSLWRRHIRSSR